MKKIFILLVMVGALFFASCATVPIATDMGTMIGESFQEAAAKGTVSATESIKAWPYAHGVIKGLMASNYEIEINPVAKGIMDDLDDLAAKETLTGEDKGKIIGSFCRLEAVAIEQTWERYGVSIMRLISKSMGG